MAAMEVALAGLVSGPLMGNGSVIATVTAVIEVALAGLLSGPETGGCSSSEMTRRGGR